MSDTRPLGGSSAVSGLSEALAHGASYLQPLAAHASAYSTSSATSVQEATRHLMDVAPHLLRPRMLSMALASSSAGSSGDRARITGWGGLPLALSRPVSLAHPARSMARFGAAVASGGGLSAAELRATEECAIILREAEAARGAARSGGGGAGVTGEVEEAELLDGDEPISLMRGYEATRPASLAGRARRREARGKAVEAPRLGLKAMGESARGLLGAPEGQDGPEAVQQRRKAGRASIRATGGVAARDAQLDEAQLLAQRDEISKEKADVGVRRALLHKEIAAVDVKIAALVTVREGLEHGLLQLREEELELMDEGAGVAELLSLQAHRRNMPGVAGASVAAATSGGDRSNAAEGATSSRRRKGPLFLPSEHDELPSGVAFMTLSGHGAPITALDFSEPYGALVSSAADEAAPIVWDLSSGGQVGRLRGHQGAVRCLQLEEELCITGGADAGIRLWDLRKVENWETRLEMKQQQRDGEAPAVAGATPVNTQELVEEAATSSIRDSSKAKDDEWSPCLRKLDGHSKAVTSLYFDEGCLVTGASDKTLRQWDLNTGQCVLTMDILWAISNPTGLPSAASHSSPRRSMNLDAGGASDYAGNFSYPTPAYEDGSWEMFTDFVGGVQFWGYALASGSGDGAVRMWDMRTGQAHRTLLGHTAPVTCLQFDETHVVSGSLDKSIRIWDLRTGAISDTIRYEHPVTALQFDSRKIMAATGENQVKIFNRTTLQHTSLAINGHTQPAERLRYMDRYAVTGGRDGLIKTWAL